MDLIQVKCRRIAGRKPGSPGFNIFFLKEWSFQKKKKNPGKKNEKERKQQKLTWKTEEIIFFLDLYCVLDTLFATNGCKQSQTGFQGSTLSHGP